MKITFFLIPKAETVFLYDNYTMRQAMERMEYHKYTAVPVLNKEGQYQYTITVQDFLWKMKGTPDLTFAQTEKISLSQVHRHTEVTAVNIDTNMAGVLNITTAQNFVPVVDYYGTYIGIIRRREILEYFMTQAKKMGVLADEIDTLATNPVNQ